MKIKVMKIQILIVIPILCIFSILNSAKAATSSSKSELGFYAQAETVFPIFVGAGVGISFFDKIDLNIKYGLTPEPYYNVIGEVAASTGGNKSYKDVIVAAFQNNSLIRAETNYYFNNFKSGWLAGFGFNYLSSSGQAGIDAVLGASTGKDYSSLKTLLSAAGRSTEVDISAKINLIDIKAGYGWDFGSGLLVKASVGYAKVIASAVSLKSGLTTFESTVAGNNLMRQSESDLQDIINQYGQTPTLAADLDYSF